jgi:hypothetical protein
VEWIVDRWPPEPVAPLLTELLDMVLAGVRRDVPGEIGTAATIAHPLSRRDEGRLRVLAATGVGQVLPPITTGHLWGPSLLVAADEKPIVTTDLWHDPRWPSLTLDAVCGQLPERHHAAVSRVRGVAAVPGVWDDTGTEPGVVVLSVYLDRPAEHSMLAVLARHERLLASAITIAAVASRSAEQADHVLDALASRAVIEQAKGVIMTMRRCDADQAWDMLRLTSQQSNVKLRELALAFVEHIGRGPVQQPGVDRRVTAGSAARDAASQLWLVLTESASLTGGVG